MRKPITQGTILQAVSRPPLDRADQRLRDSAAIWPGQQDRLADIPWHMDISLLASSHTRGQHHSTTGFKEQRSPQKELPRGRSDFRYEQLQADLELSLISLTEQNVKDQKATDVWTMKQRRVQIRKGLPLAAKDWYMEIFSSW